MIRDHQLMLARRQVAWGVLSLVGGLVLLSAGPGGFRQAFAIQALAWGVIIGASALAGLRRAGSPFGGGDPDRQARRLRNALLASSLLDAFFVAGGLVIAISLGRQEPFAAGSGWGIVLQGAVLLLLDLTHALWIPPEPRLPDLGWYAGAQHEGFNLPGTRGDVLLLHGLAGSPDEVRPLAEALQAAGWSVHVPLLPGHGAEFGSILQCTTHGWLEAVEGEAAALPDHDHPPVLVGFSMGGALALCTATQCNPRALVLLAPFWPPGNRAVRLAGGLLRLFLPAALPLRWVNRLPEERLREGLQELLPEMDPDDPNLLGRLAKVKVPLAFLQQFGLLGQAVEKAAPQVTCPVLIVQGADDPAVQPARTRRLAARLGRQPEYVELPGGHELTRREHPAHPAVVDTVLTFLDRF